MLIPWVWRLATTMCFMDFGFLCASFLLVLFAMHYNCNSTLCDFPSVRLCSRHIAHNRPLSHTQITFLIIIFRERIFIMDNIYFDYLLFAAKTSRNVYFCTPPAMGKLLTPPNNFLPFHCGAVKCHRYYERAMNGIYHLTPIIMSGLLIL